MEKPKTKVEIPALAAGTSNSSKMSKELTIKAIEAKLKSLESQKDNFVINQTSEREVPLIQKYQFNKNNSNERGHNIGGGSSRQFGQRKTGPYNRNQRRPKR